jgi:hypothetical protein
MRQGLATSQAVPFHTKHRPTGRVFRERRSRARVFGVNTPEVVVEADPQGLIIKHQLAPALVPEFNRSTAPHRHAVRFFVIKRRKHLSLEFISCKTPLSYSLPDTDDAASSLLLQASQGWPWGQVISRCGSQAQQFPLASGDVFLDGMIAASTFKTSS